MNDHSAWTLTAESAIHESGLKLVFSGVPGTNDFEINPERIPESLSSREQIRLLREVVAAYEEFMGGQDTPQQSGQQRPKGGQTAGVDVQVKRRRRRRSGESGQDTA